MDGYPQKGKARETGITHAYSQVTNDATKSINGMQLNKKGGQNKTKQTRLPLILLLWRQQRPEKAKKRALRLSDADFVDEEKWKQADTTKRKRGSSRGKG